MPPITKLKSLMRRISHQWAGGKVHGLDIGILVFYQGITHSVSFWYKGQSKEVEACMPRQLIHRGTREEQESAV